MNHYKKLVAELRNYYLLLFTLYGSIIAVAWWVGTQLYHINPTTLLIGLWASGFVLAFIFALGAAQVGATVTRALWQAIWHVSNEASSLPPPDLKNIKVGRELVTSLVKQVYDMASLSGDALNKDNQATNGDIGAMVVANLPQPLFVLDNQQTIVAASDAALQYCGLPSTEVIGKKFYDVANLAFPSEQTLDAWLKDCRSNKVKDTHSWDRVRLILPDQKGTKQFDMAAYFTNKSTSGIEVLLTLFDHSSQYGGDDKQIDFVAMAVHELRTPLTLMRGYMEVIEEELGDKLDPELAAFMSKLRASAQQLNAFVSNILNVARIEDNQLILKLREESIEDIINTAAKDLELQAGVRGKAITITIPKDLPKVAAERVSIHEIINNLVDNAIKYSGSSDKINIVCKLQADGTVETTVEDFGVGIPDNIMPHIFDKFYRSHQVSDQVGGTGLGLYLCKALVNAHGGSIWVKSKEGQGTMFGFTLRPYSSLSDEEKANQSQDGIIRGAHGWIKNHSLYRG